MTSLVSYEQYVDETIDVFLNQLRERFAGNEEIVDLPRWLHYYSLDVIFTVSYGRPFGFLKAGKDIEDIIKNTQSMLSYFGPISQIPWLDKLFLKNPLLLWLGRRGFLNASSPVARKVLRLQTARVQQDAEGKLPESSSDTPSSSAEDLLSKFIQAKHQHPDIITDREITMLGLSMFFAGSDTTAWTLTAIIYYLLRNPPALHSLRAELSTHLNSNTSKIPFSTAQSLPYLNCCIKEAFRLHPAARFTALRIVPPGGTTICSHDIPAGVEVGVNAWPMHRNTEIFGDDVDDFRPERWLEQHTDADGVSSSKHNAGDRERLARMNACLSQFGHGSFQCIGKNISLLEMYKLVPRLLREFELEMVNPEKEWEFGMGAFVGQKGVDVRVRSRSWRAKEEISA
ncbi:MAG: hypothetical protein Q9227_004764 [Pyrenula ochraceoflavens]